MNQTSDGQREQMTGIATNTGGIEGMANTGSIENSVMRLKKLDMQTITDIGVTFHNHISAIEIRGKGSRELSLARTNLDQALMWAVKHITG